MKKVLACVVFVGILIASPLAYAQAMKFGHFDLYRVMNESKRWAKERDAFVKVGNDLKNQYEKKRDELNALKETLEKKGGMLSEQARKEKERDYQQKATDLDRFAQDSDAKLKQLNKEMSERFMKSLAKVLQKLGADEKYTFILEVGLVAYATKELDITDEVIKAFDAAKE
jgi:outer membrane protein